MSRLITIDNGGTLTDVCVIDGQQVAYTKTLTTPHDLSRCLFDGLERVSHEVGDARSLPALLRTTDYIRYSTTQGTNALVQRVGPRLGLLVDDPRILEDLAREEETADLYAALVGSRSAVLDLGVDDETLEGELVTVCNRLAAEGASRFVISVGGPDGAVAERRIRDLLLAIFPRQLLGAVPLLFSNELIGGDDDVRRTWSSLLNAFLHPAMERFLFNAESRLREHRTRNPLLVFRNDGASSRVAKSAAIKTYSSGPRGGVEGTRALARHYGLDEVLMVDVGGTTTDLAMVRDGAVDIDWFGTVAGVTTSLPLARITSHGIGGSSVFHVTDGVLGVGPRSVGAAPGPACFGLGGTQATITDVLLLTGVLDSSTYLGGTFRLDVDRSAAAVRATIADPLGIDLPEALTRMQDTYAARMAEVLRTEAGPATTIAAFGGAGPMSICAAARRAGVPNVVIPRSAAVFSAFGIGFSDIGQTYRTAAGDRPDDATVTAAIEELLAHAERDMFAENIAIADCELTWAVVDAAGATTPLGGRDDAARALKAGGRVQLQVVAVLPHPRLEDPVAISHTAFESSGTRAVADATGTRSEVPVVDLARQEHGAEGHGPLVVEGPFFTMFVPDGWTVAVSGSGDLLLTDTPGSSKEND